MPPVCLHVPYKAVHSDLFHLEVRFCAYDDERLYGLGQHQHGRLNQKDCTIDLIQRNTEVSIPFLFSSRGYGFLWHNPGIGRVELGDNGTRWVAEASPQLDYWITAGGTPAEIMEHYADATGHPSEFPEWAAGFWQCKLRYRTQDELLSVAREYKRRGLPLSVIVIENNRFYRFYPATGKYEFFDVGVPVGVLALRASGGLVITSAWTELGEEQRKNHPLASDLFRLKTGVKGQVRPKFAG